MSVFYLISNYFIFFLIIWKNLLLCFLVTAFYLAIIEFLSTVSFFWVFQFNFNHNFMHQFNFYNSFMLNFTVMKTCLVCPSH